MTNESKFSALHRCLTDLDLWNRLIGVKVSVGIRSCWSLGQFDHLECWVQSGVWVWVRIWETLPYRIWWKRRTNGMNIQKLISAVSVYLFSCWLNACLFKKYSLELFCHWFGLFGLLFKLFKLHSDTWIEMKSEREGKKHERITLYCYLTAIMTSAVMRLSSGFLAIKPSASSKYRAHREEFD